MMNKNFDHLAENSLFAQSAAGFSRRKFFLTPVEPVKPAKQPSSMTSWGQGFEKIDQRLAQEFIESETVRLAGLEKLEELNLPRYQKTISTLDQFYQNPDYYFQQLNTQTFYPKLLKLNGFRKHKLDATHDEVFTFLTEQQKLNKFKGKDTFVLSEYLRNDYGYQVVINHDGSCHVDLVRGKIEGLTYGWKTPWVMLQTDPYLGIFKFKVNHEDDGIKKTSPEEFGEVKQACLAMLETIPEVQTQNPRPNYRPQAPNPLANSSDNSGAKMIKHPGYYEGLFNRDENTKGLKPIFIDYREDSKYLLPNRAY